MTRLEQIVELGGKRIDAVVEAVIDKHEESIEQNKWFEMELFLEKHLKDLKDYDEV